MSKGDGAGRLQGRGHPAGTSLLVLFGLWAGTPRLAAQQSAPPAADTVPRKAAVADKLSPAVAEGVCEYMQNLMGNLLMGMGSDGRSTPRSREVARKKLEQAMASDTADRVPHKSKSAYGVAQTAEDSAKGFRNTVRRRPGDPAQEVVCKPYMP